ncbi:hypothetical protein AN958_11389 [Leucoagaricus sp. SymC.cos]|nr:hypothetical protein AN958_11389 [Leucoagaricus sp. SymC.cos]
MDEGEDEEYEGDYEEEAEKYVDEGKDEEYEGDYEEAEKYVDEGEDEEYEKDSEEEEESEGVNASSTEVIELLSDDEPTPRVRFIEEEDEFLSDESAAGSRSSPVQYDEDAEASEEEDDRGEALLRQDEDEDEIQPSDEDTSFPPHASTKEELTNPLIEVRDPWAQVQRYAEDYYAGGEITPRRSGSRPGPGRSSEGLLSAHHLEGFGEDENEEFDEQDHLFNRLQSHYANRPFAVSYSKLQPTLGFKITSGPGTNDEPIMIDSDDEDEAPGLVISAAQREQEQVRVLRREEEQDEKEYFLDKLEDEVAGEHSEERDETPTCQPEVTEGLHEVSVAVVEADVEEQSGEEEPVEEDAHEDVQPPVTPSIHTIQADVQQIDQVASLPESVQNIANWSLNFPASYPLAQHDPFPNAPLAASNHLEIPSTLPDLPSLQHDLDTITANVTAQIFEFDNMMTPYALGSIGDTSQQTIHEQTQVMVSVDSGTVVAEPEVIDVDASEDEDETEVDELDEPGAYPLMTSDLGYPEPEIEVEAETEAESEEKDPGDLIQVSTPLPGETVMFEARVVPSEILEVPEKIVESDKEPEVQIFVEEPEEIEPSTPAEEISISIHAATPIPPSPITPAVAEFEESPSSPRAETKETAEAEGKVECEPILVTDVPQAPHVLASEEVGTAKGPITVDDEDELPEVSIQKTVGVPATPEPLIGGESLAPHFEMEDVDITITIEKEDGAVPSKEHVTFDLGEQVEYAVEEPLPDPGFLALGGPSRAVSLGMQSDEVIPPTVATGDVEELLSDIEPEFQGAAEATITHGLTIPRDRTDVVEAQSIYVESEFELEVTEAASVDVRNLQSTAARSLDDEMRYGDEEQEQITTRAKVFESSTQAASPPTSKAAPETNYDASDDYFAQPGSPVMDHYGLMELGTPGSSNFPRSPSGGGLPTIIQLPGTPQKVLSPGGTPGFGPTPVSIAVEPAVLKALKTNPALFSPPAALSQEPSVHRVEENATASTSATELSTIESTEPVTGTSPTLPLPPLVVEPEPPSTNGNSLHTSFLATTVPTRPTLPTLFDDPYPYSLSTPGPQNEEEGTEEEESTEQENSISSTSSVEKLPSSAETADEPIFSGTTGMETHFSPPETTEPAESVWDFTTKTGIEEAIEKAREAEKGLVSVEAEADKLIDEFLVDEPDSDTDADGEADPEFVALESSEEIVIQEVDEVVPQSGVEMIVEEVVTPFVQETPGEAPDPTQAEEGWEREDGESESEAEVEAATIPESLLEQRSELTHPFSSPLVPRTHVAPASPQVEVAPVTLSRVPIASSTFPPPTSASSPGYVGVVPYQFAATAYMRALDSHFAPQWAHPPAQNLPPLELATAPVYSLQRDDHETAVSSSLVQLAAATQGPVLAPASLDTQPQGAALTGIEPKVEGSRPKVHISVEDPYHADNDSEREQGSSPIKNKKRKRSHSDASGAESPITPAKSVSMGKGKGRATSSRSTAKGSRLTKESSKRSIHSTSTQPTKRNSLPVPLTNLASRSPSVASTVISESSMLTQSSPTHPPLASSEPRPFLHAHSRRKRAKAPTTMQEQLQKQRLPSLSSVASSRSGVLRAEDVLTKAPSITSASTRSHVTRSHCRYHKISIPKSENGPRISFLVPGCSLNDEALINEEEIEDHGEAILQGDTRIVDDIETLDFEAYLHWVMRQLVGPEILRENEVFYLPEPGEEIVRNPHRPEKKKGVRPEKKRSKLADEAPVTASSPQNSSTVQPPSRKNSTASSESARQLILGSDSEDLTTVTETEDDTSFSGKPESKAEVASVETDPSGVSGSLRQTDSGSVFSRKRGRRLGQDAAAYYPSTGSDQGSSTDYSDYNPSRKAASRGRGQKRPRASENTMTDGADGRKIKKPKTQSAQSQSQDSPSQNQSSVQSIDQLQPQPFGPPRMSEGAMSLT